MDEKERVIADKDMVIADKDKFITILLNESTKLEKEVDELKKKSAGK